MKLAHPFGVGHVTRVRGKLGEQEAAIVTTVVPSLTAFDLEGESRRDAASLRHVPSKLQSHNKRPIMTFEHVCRTVSGLVSAATSKCYAIELST